MNQKQKTLIIFWIVGLVLVIALFISTFAFDNPHPIVLFIISIFPLISGKYHKELREMKKDSFNDFIEYAESRKGLMIALALYAVILPFTIYMLIAKGYMKATTSHRDILALACIVMIPLVLFDIGHRIYTIKKHDDNT